MSPTIHTHSLTGNEATSTIARALNLLRPHLPISLPLFRRLQFGRFFDATCLLSSIDLLANAEQDSPPEPWALAFVDRSCRPETEVWLFGSWEVSPPAPESAKDNDELVLALARTMKALPIPQSIHHQASTATSNGSSSMSADSEQDTGGHTRTDYANHATNTSIMLWGAIHSSTFHILQRLDLLSPEHKAVEEPNHTFLFDIASLPQPSQLPEGLQWGKVNPVDFELIKSRTQIPRQTRTMAILPSLALYPQISKGSAEHIAPIAWAFIGLDASLTTLHVEPAYRGRGLAKSLTAKIFREGMGHFHTDDDVVDTMALGYVQVGNKASEGMCRSLGGKADWECYWLRVDLSRG